MKNTTTKKCMGSRIKRLLLSVSFLLAGTFIFAQERTIDGTLTDNTGVALPGVNIYIKGTTTGTISDINGKYQIKVPSPEAILVFKYVGYTTQEITVADQTVITVTLNEDLQQLNEVVVVGYGVQKKKLNTGSTLNIGGDNIQSLRTNSPMEALKGITPGISITQNNGVPGSGTKVIIRGVGTNGVSDPLYVVDGIIVGNIDYLSSSDIETLDVLKDGATAAIYGSRAANGVIMVTTKKGKKDTPTSVSFDMYYGIQNIFKKPNLLNAKQYIEIMDEANANVGGKAYDWATLVPNYDKILSGEYNGTNWVDEIENKDASVQNYSLNINGGSQKSAYSIGASYYGEDGILGKQVNNEFKRTTLRLNTDNTLIQKNGRDILLVGENVTYSNTKKPAFRTGGIYWSDLHNMMVASPLLPVYDNTGANLARAYSADNDTTYYSQTIPWDAGGINPIASMEYNSKFNYNDNNTVNASAYVELRPIKALSLRSGLGINAWNGNSRSWTPSYTLGPKTTAKEDEVSQSMYSGYSYIWTNTATYNQSFEKHNFTVLLGQEQNKTLSNLTLSASNKVSLFNDAEHAYISNVPISDLTFLKLSGKDEYGQAILSYFSRVSYDYDETYMFTFVARADGSSRFPLGHRWGQFYSVSGGVMLTNFEFMDWSKSWLNSFKLRGSWGQNGNENIPSFQYLSNQTYGSDKSADKLPRANYYFGTDKTTKYLGSYPARVPNPYLTWETSEQTDLGFDLYAFSNKMNITFDIYEKDTKGWLVNPPSLGEWGANGAYANGGNITNKGFELAIRWNDRAGDFKYGATVSIAYNKNEVTRINTADSILHGSIDVLSQGTSELYRAQVGYPIGYFWGFKSDGVFQDSAEVEAFTKGKTIYYKKEKGKLVNNIKPGDVRLVDMNGDTILNDKDKVQIGDPHPDVILGLQLDAEYKGLYIQATANGNFGQQVAKSYRSFVDGAKQNYTTDVYDRWHGAGTSNKMPRLTPTGSTQISDIYIEDADFIRISNVTIGYNIKELINKLPLSELKIYFSVKNLYTITNYSGLDPEVGYAPDSWGSGVDLGLYPLSRSYMVGLSARF